MAEARVLPCPAEPRVRASEGPGGLLWVLQECVLSLHFPQWHHLSVLGMQPLYCPPGKVSQEEPPRTRAQGWVQMGSWAALFRAVPYGFTQSSGHTSPSPNIRVLQPGASWITDCTRHHCSTTPLGAVLVRSPISCPPLNETECAKVSTSLLPPQRGLRPGASLSPWWWGGGGGAPGSLCVPCHPSFTPLCAHLL